MLWTLATILVLLWILGVASSYTIHGLIHLLLVLAVLTVAVRLIQGNKTLL